MSYDLISSRETQPPNQGTNLQYQAVQYLLETIFSKYSGILYLQQKCKKETLGTLIVGPNSGTWWTAVIN